jgi:hypothetical protein
VTIISAIAIAVSFHGLFQLLSISTVLLTVWVPARQLDQERPGGWSDVQGNKVSALLLRDDRHAKSYRDPRHVEPGRA